ncbi:PLP-dependent transferase [Neolentinus lepideus HHB14362 ss-1]|uniref:PLP-dependent transferase n=1 Tax=Neolentinus lepideus HHB14362 ss-1 TaxID=1314782 RepID=A0A165TUU7_9AGAM|nr:PLP-dependent transferase [Neolentinus lepideus HHB14362 ss-1]
MPSSLTQHLENALASRDARQIRRRLPESRDSSALVDFSSNDYLSLSTNNQLREHFLCKLRDAPQILGSGGSRLLVNGQAHADLESRLAKFFGAPSALLFNSGYDANVGFFQTIPQPGDIVVTDEYIHASVYDGIRASRVGRKGHRTFAHNCVASLRSLLWQLLAEDGEMRSGGKSVFVAVESLYSMDGTFAPLRDIVRLLESLFPVGNAYLIVDEAHATGIYGPRGRGLVAHYGLEDKILARLHTFGKALAATGAVILTTPLICDYLINYARSLIYTTSLSFANIIAISCSFDFLEDSEASKLATHLLVLIRHFFSLLRPHLQRIPAHVLSLPSHLATSPLLLQSPIIALLTSKPRPLSAYLYQRGMNARPITWPTVPKGKDRVRVCLHAGMGMREVERLVEAVYNRVTAAQAILCWSLPTRIMQIFVMGEKYLTIARYSWIL